MILPCDNHPEESAMILLTNLEDGSTATFCGECLVAWAGMLIEGLTADQAVADGDVHDLEEAATPEPVEPAPDAEEFPTQGEEPAKPAQAEEHAKDGAEATAPGN